MQSLYWFAALLGHGAMWVEAVNRLHGLGWPRKVIDAATVACAVGCAGIPLAIAGTLLQVPAAAPTPAWVSAYMSAAIGALAVIVAMRIGLAWDPRRCKRTVRSAASTLDLAAELGPEATGSATLHRLAHLPGNSVLRPSFERLTAPVERLPAALEALKIAHLTDLHMSGRLSQRYFDRLVEEVNRWAPDLVCITGDIVERTPQVAWVKPTLGRLQAAAGVYFILGNHDNKIDSAALRQALSAAGLIDVGGLAHEVVVRGCRLTICGDERPWFKGAPPLRGDEPLVLCLAHTPDRFDGAIRRGIDLMLAGHNHGGQVCVPGVGALLCPSRHGVRYAAGTYRHGRTVMHVGRGSGSLFPLRYSCPPEVTLLTLTRG